MCTSTTDYHHSPRLPAHTHKKSNKTVTPYAVVVDQFYAFEERFLRALTMQTLSWSLKLFITSNNVELESK